MKNGNSADLASGLRASILMINQLTASNKQQMYELYERYYENVNFKEFLSDLGKKTAVIVLTAKQSRAIVGFSTLLNFEVSTNGKKISGIFSGDTIVEKAYWGQTALQKAFLQYMISLRVKNPFRETYWFLISKGYKTYLLLANNFPIHYPRFEYNTPESKLNVIDAFATHLYPKYYNSRMGLIRFPYESARIKDGVAPIGENLLVENPRIAFFTDRNPNWSKGEELACIGKITWALPFQYLTKLMVRKLFFGRKSRALRPAEKSASVS